MIKIENLSKSFRVYKHRTGMLKDVVGLAREGHDFDTVHSLNNLNLTIPSGKVHGIIGMNGAGKSTLLKILTGVLDPSSGKVFISGRVAALLELGTGFHGELSGRENIYLNGSIMRMSRSEVEAKIEEIKSFSELGAFFDRPVKIYSSGMYVRLAFAFAVCVEPDVLIIDEALSVGDAYFQQKCLKKIRSFKDQGVTILFVSHDLSAVKMLCEDVTLLSQGKILFTGSPIQALDLYNAILAEHQNQMLIEARAQKSSDIDQTSTYESGSKEMEIESVKLFDQTHKETSAFVSGDKCVLVVRARCNVEGIVNPTCGILIRDRLSYDVFGTNTHSMRLSTGPLNKGQLIEYRFEFDLDLGAGDYTLTIALHADNSHVEKNYHWLERAQLFKVLPSVDYTFIGVSRLKPQCSFRSLS